MWATLHLSKDEDHFQRVLRNVEIGSSQKSFHHSAESYGKSLRRRTVRSDPTIGSDRKSLEIVFFARSRNSPAIAFKRIYLQRFCVRVRRKMSDASTIRRTVGEGKNCLFRLVVSSTTLPGSQACSSGGFTQDTQQLNSSTKSRRCSTSTKRIRSISTDGSSSCRYTMTLAGTRNAMKKCANGRLLPYPPMPIYFRKYDGLSSNHETKTNGTGLTLTYLVGIGTALQKM